MDFLTEYAGLIATAAASVGTAIVAVTSLVKALKSEKRAISSISEIQSTNQINKEAIVQGFKSAVLPNEIKVSLNNQTQKVLGEGLAEIMVEVKKGESYRNRAAYWNLKILASTAAYNKLTVEEQAEINELLKFITDEEKIIETL